MKTLYENIIKTDNLNCSKIEINFCNYDLNNGMHFQYRLFTSNGFILDGGDTYISGQAFQSWPSAPEGQEETFDQSYIVAKILENLNLQKDELAGL